MNPEIRTSDVQIAEQVVFTVPSLHFAIKSILTQPNFGLIKKLEGQLAQRPLGEYVRVSDGKDAVVGYRKDPETNVLVSCYRIGKTRKAAKLDLQRLLLEVIKIYKREISELMGKDSP